MRINFFKTFLAVFFLTMLVGCDPNHLKECEWFLVPEPRLKEKIKEPGMVPICARNFELNIQNCQFQMSLEEAEKAYKRKFRYSDLEVDKSGPFPRRIKTVTYCD